MFHTFFNLGELWTSRVNSNPDDFAIRYSSAEYTFKSVDRSASKIAARMAVLPYKKQQVVALFHDKTPEFFACMVACLKLGRPYVCLDLNNPAGRVQKILEICDAALAVVPQNITKDTIELLHGHGLITTTPKALETDGGSLGMEWVECLEPIDWESIAYIMFTSGSTGSPKGVAISHGSLLSFCEWASREFLISQSTISVQSSPMYFDNSVFDFYGVMMNGGSIVPISEELLGQTPVMFETIRQTKCNMWFGVPSLFVYLISFGFLNEFGSTHLNKLVFGGEVFPKSVLLKAFSKYRDRIEFINVYGPTECTCICSLHRISHLDFESSDEYFPLGNLNPNFRFRVVNEDGQEIKSEIVGELWLSGPNLSPGYWGDIEKSEAQFVIDRTEKKTSRRYYKTGDLVYCRGEVLYFKGRKDNQIKHLGYRIELEEIEAALQRVPGVKRSAVVYVKESEEFGLIKACVESERSSDKLLEEIIQSLKSQVPRYMIPHEIMIKEQFPTTRNGKVDRSALFTQPHPLT